MSDPSAASPMLPPDPCTGEFVIGEQCGRRCATIIDEARSSQDGRPRAARAQALSQAGEEGEEERRWRVRPWSGPARPTA